MVYSKLVFFIKINFFDIFYLFNFLVMEFWLIWLVLKDSIGF